MRRVSHASDPAGDPDPCVRAISGCGEQVEIAADGERVPSFKDLFSGPSGHREPVVVTVCFDEPDWTVPAMRQGRVSAGRPANRFDRTRLS